MDNKKNILAILISPIIGYISFLILFSTNNLIDTFYPKEMDGPMIGNGILYFFLFPILFIGLFIFQIIIIEPLFRRFRKREELNKSLIIKTCLIIIFSFSFIFATIFGTIQFGIRDYLITFLIGIVIWISYFAPNMISYYLIYVKRIDMNKKG